MTAQIGPGASAAGAAPAGIDHELARPKLRGVLHMSAVPFFAVNGVLLTALAVTQPLRLACAVYALSVVALLATSATYHRITWSPSGRAIMRRADHSMIFVLIAGTYTPVAVAALHGWPRLTVLLTVWIGAAAGVTLQWLKMPVPGWVTTIPYLALGWVALFFIPQFFAGAGILPMVLIFTGGLLYSLGAVAYGTRRPRLSPGTFGYHEVFHAATIAAALAQTAAIWLLVV